MDVPKWGFKNWYYMRRKKRGHLGLFNNVKDDAGYHILKRFMLMDILNAIVHKVLIGSHT